MSNTILGNAFKDVADAIRAKGVTGTMSPLEMPVKVASIQTGKRKFGVSIDNLLGDVDQQGDLEIPSEPFSFQSTEVRGLGDNVLNAKFQNNNGLTAISLPNLTSLGIAAMYAACFGATSLKSVDLSGLVTCGEASQGSGAYNANAAFQGCTSLESLDLRSLATIAGAGGMQLLCQGCTSLRQVNISNLTTLSSNYALGNAFQDCTSLQSIDLSHITTISGTSALQNAFQGCTALTGVDLTGISSINAGSALRYAFSGCTSLVELNMSNLTTIGRATFCLSEICKNCTSLKRVYFTKLSSVNSQRTYTFQNAFDGCTSLELVDFSQATAVPELPGNTPFANTNNTFKIVVPDALYSTWISTAGWSTYASHIVKVSEYTPAS